MAGPQTQADEGNRHRLVRSGAPPPEPFRLGPPGPLLPTLAAWQAPSQELKDFEAKVQALYQVRIRLGIV